MLVFVHIKYVLYICSKSSGADVFIHCLVTKDMSENNPRETGANFLGQTQLILRHGDGVGVGSGA